MTTSRLRTLAAATSMLALSLVLGMAHAQDNEPVDADPPDRAARLSYLEGDVSMQPAGEGDWAPALLNRPLTTGDKVWTEKGGRAEIQVGQAAVRLGADTGFSFLNVDDDTVQMRMTAGVVIVRVTSLIENDHIEIDTPNVALSLLRPGNYRVEVNDAGDTTTVKISEGEAEATGSGEQNVIVRNQQVATFRGTEQVAMNFSTLGGPDEFDSWSLERDRRDERVASSPTSEYVSPDVTGYEDLDDNGTWVSEPEYGYVWTPSRVPLGWAPYSYGRWVWVRPWGWTWIDDQPWGYAPFHYGRWAYARNRWCWVPGPRAVRAVYAPALVGWVGSPGVGVSVSFGHNVGWFPLGPREVYVPARRFSHGYVQRVNYSNTVIVNRNYITNVYNNRARENYRNRGAATAVAREIFASGGRVGDHRVRIDDRDIPRSQSSAVAPHIAPSRESRYGGPARAGRPPPQDVMNRQVIMRREPPASGAGWQRRPGTPAETPRTVDQRPDRAQYSRSSPKMAPTLQTPESPRQQQRPSFDRSTEARTDRPSRDQMERYQQQFPERQANEQRERQDRDQRQQDQRRQLREQQSREQERRVAEFRETQQRQYQQQRELRDQQVQRARAERQQEQRVNVERPQRYERPPQAERPQQYERPQRTERPEPAPRPQEDRSSRSSGTSSSGSSNTQARPPKGWGHSRDN